MDYYVYGYFEPGFETPFYIGKGRRTRATDHLWIYKQSASQCLFYEWLRDLAARGITPDVRLLHEDMADEDAKAKEVELITFWGRIDTETGCLTNQTAGGDGDSDLGPKARETIRQKVAAKWQDPEFRERMRVALRQPASRGDFGRGQGNVAES